MVRDGATTNKITFFVACIAVGIIVSVFSALFLVFPSLVPNLSTVSQNYSGLGIQVNKTDISPTLLVIEVTSDPNKLFFQFYFSCDRNGTYNFALSFPFNMTRKISSRPENMLFNYSSSYGTGVWFQCDSNGTGSRDISGSFEIEDTFRSGSGGYYTFALPFGFGVNSQEIFGNITSQLNVTSISGIQTYLYFNIDSSKYEITHTFPERRTGWLTLPDRSVNWTGGYWEFQDGLQQTIFIYSKKLAEIRDLQISLFLGGIALSIGIQIVITGGYDLCKERLGQNGDHEIVTTAWLYPAQKEIWVKCPTCLRKNLIQKEFSSFHPTTHVPYKTECSGCRARIIVGKCARAHKNWKKPNARAAQNDVKSIEEPRNS